MMHPDYYWKLIDHLDSINSHATISFTSNLWPFYKNPDKWVDLFTHRRMGISTSFQYGGGRLKGDLTEYSEEDFWNVSNMMLERVGYRPDFITVITEAFIVGICLLALTKLLENFIVKTPGKIDMDIIKLIFISGFLFHIIFEYTGINFWYSINYPRS